MNHIFLILLFSAAIVIILIDNFKKRKNVGYKPKKYLWLIFLFLVLIIDLLVKK